MRVRSEAAATTASKFAHSFDGPRRAIGDSRNCLPRSVTITQFQAMSPRQPFSPVIMHAPHKNVPTAPCARPVASIATRASVPQQHFEFVQAARGLPRSQTLAIRYLLLPGLDESVAIIDFYVQREALAPTEYAGTLRIDSSANVL
jgi:hypothetical protein